MIPHVDQRYNWAVNATGQDIGAGTWQRLAAAVPVGSGGGGGAAEGGVVVKTLPVHLFAESCQQKGVVLDPKCEGQTDRYGVCCFIVSRGVSLFRSRYPDYPWPDVGPGGSAATTDGVP